MKPFVYCTIFLSFFSVNFTIAQQKSTPVKYDSLACNIQAYPLSQARKFRLSCPNELELPMLIALDHFPELKAKQIIFKERKINTTLNARPTVISLLFSKRTNRTYVIRINTNQHDSIIQLCNVPFNAKIGLFAHEISHFEDYQKRSFFGVLGRGLAYSNKKAKAKFEKEIDLSTIQHGLGWQLYDWSDFVLNQSKASNAYKAFKAETYMKPHEIKSCIEQLLIQ